MHGFNLGSDSMTMAVFFGMPHFLDGAFLSALQTLGMLDSSVNLLSPSPSMVVSLSLCLAPLPTFSLRISNLWPVGESTRITMGELACSASPPQVRCSVYMVMCWGGIGVTGSVGAPILAGLGVSAIFFIWGVMGTHCFLSSSSASIFSISQSHAIAAVRPSRSSIFCCRIHSAHSLVRCFSCDSHR